MNRIILLVVLIFAIGKTYGQSSKPFTLGLNSGFANIVMQDQSITHNTYKGRGYFPVQVSGSYLVHHNLFAICGSFHHGRLSSSPSELYEYNYMIHDQYGLELLYQRLLLNIHERTKLFLGVSNQTQYTTHHLYWKSYLYDYTAVSNKSYVFNMLNLSPDLLLEQSTDKHHLSFSVRYSLLMWTARPDDVYIKRSGGREGQIKKLMLPNDFKHTRLLLSYRYLINHHLALSAGYKMEFQAGNLQGEYRILQNTYLIGLVKTF